MSKSPKKRADELIFQAGLARSRSQAQALIMAGEVLAQTPAEGPEAEAEAGPLRPVKKAGEFWPEGSLFTVTPRRRFASRGGHKLEGALEDLKIDPAGWKVLDIGASTGGFTDCLLQHGAAEVTAVDVGRNLLDLKLRQDSRVIVHDGINARFLAEKLPGAAFDLAVMDLSFISLDLILPQAARLLKPGGCLLAMVKPQFEVGRHKVGKKGVVRDPALIKEAADKISALGPALEPPFREVGRAPSRLTGPEGNQEIFLLFQPLGGPEDQANS